MTRDVCPACAADDFRTVFTATDRLFRTTDKHFEVVECRGCGLLRLFPRPPREELARYYPDGYWNAPRGTLAERIEESYRRFVLGDHVAFVRRALEDAGEAGPVLDVGCGSGLFLRMLKEQGSAVVGLDLSVRAASIAWRSNGVPCFSGDLTRAPLADGSCSAVTMFHVLEHLENPAEHLCAAHRLLRPCGRIIVQVPNAACWQFILFGENWRGIEVPRHLIDFRACDLENLLHYCGFEVVRRKHFSLRDNPACFATSVAPALDPIVRRIRGAAERAAVRFMKDMLYFAIVAAAVPFTALEAACRAGATVMMEARKKP